MTSTGGEGGGGGQGTGGGGVVCFRSAFIDRRLDTRNYWRPIEKLPSTEVFITASESFGDK